MTDIIQACPDRKSCIRLCAGVALVIAFGYALLFTVALLPQENLRKHLLRADASGFFSENYPQYEWARPLFNRLDMYTECIGAGIALNMRADWRTLLEMPTFGECSVLHTVLAAEDFKATPHGYMRYIHGYQIVLKSLYTLFPLEMVRVVTAGTSLFLLFFLYIALYRKTAAGYAAAVVMSFFLTSSPNMLFTVTHATQFWVALAAAAAAVLGYRRICPIVFFGLVGALDAFCSFLNMGSLSLALPLLCYTLARWIDGAASGRIRADTFWGCVGWSFGFVLPWLVKWLVLFFVFEPTKAALFGVTLEQYVPRDLVMIATAAQRNFVSANWPVIVLVFVVSALRRWRMGLHTPPGLWSVCLPGVIPLLWMCILPGQSGIKHSTFTNLIVWPFLAASLLLLLSMPRDARDLASSRHEKIL